MLHVITGLGLGGAEKIVLQLCENLNHNQFDVKLAVLTPRAEAVEVFKTSFREVVFFDLSKGAIWKSLGLFIGCVIKFSPQVIHAHMYHSQLAGLLAKLALRCKCILVFTPHLVRFSFGRHLITTFLKPLRDVDIKFHQKQGSSMLRPDAVSISNGVVLPTNDCGRTGWGQYDTVRLVSVGRLEHQKDPIGLLEAVSAIGLENWTLDFVGDGPLREALQRRIQRLGLDERIRLLGVRSDVPEILNDCHIFVQFSRFEGMPIAVLEAGACSMPVVATNVGLNELILRDGHGWAVKRDLFSQTLRSVIENPELALDAGRRLRSRVAAEYSIEAVTRLHHKLYLNALQRAIG